MDTKVMALSQTQTKDDFLYFLFAEQNIPSLPKTSPLAVSCVQLQLNTKQYPDTHCHFLDSVGNSIASFCHYGTAAGLYWIWKNTTCPYIGFSLSETFPNASEQEITDFFKSSRDALMAEKKFSRCPLQENYRTLYYGYDFRMMLSVLKRYAPKYYTFATEKVFIRHDFLEPTGIFKRKVLEDFCAWLFPLLKECETHLSPKYSTFQNRFLEHLTYYLFILYFLYNEENLQIQYVEKAEIDSNNPKNEFRGNDLYEDIISLIREHKLEDAQYLLEKGDPQNNFLQLHDLFTQYNKERRYYKTTVMEQWKRWPALPESQQKAPAIKRRKPKILIFEWDSVSHKESVAAFKQLGFEISSYRTPYGNWIYDEAFLVQINRHLDLHQFDLVFSLNFFAMVAEACYVHDTPYIAWTYDSPSPIGDIRYLKYPTNHVFMFDSADVEEYHLKGCTDVRYMPLAVNVERYDSMRCSPNDIKKYSSEISFVGRLYDTKLPQAMGYLTDYQKAYLNALVDYQQPLYGYSVFPNILSTDLMNWLDNPDFNKIINLEGNNKMQEDDPDALKTPDSGTLGLLLNKLVTNRERLLLISLLSKHHQFKLYSTSTHELFQNTIECGTINYYTEMPFAFRYSKLNLNMTLRCIRTGIPLRCLDIMGCHGLLLTNYQKDFEKHFKDQENLLIYHSIEEAYDKTQYYLSHEKERQKIAAKGYETVKQYYNYPTVLSEMLNLSGLGYLLPKE